MERTITVVSVVHCGPHYSTVDLQLVWWPGGDSHGASVVVVSSGGGAVTPLSSPVSTGQRKRPRLGSQPGGLLSHLTALPGWPDQGQAMQRSDRDLAGHTQSHFLSTFRSEQPWLSRAVCNKTNISMLTVFSINTDKDSSLHCCGPGYNQICCVTGVTRDSVTKHTTVTTPTNTQH